MNVVVVESPAKARTINKYLGPGYRVLASFGHVRDLPPKDGSVRPDEDFAMVWETDSRGETRIKEIAQAVKQADQLILATDPDREGEAISWHISEELGRRKALNGVEVKRVVFNEVTKNAVLEAMRHPRDLDKDLIEAYLARRALDYLVGFTLSPVLWRKLPGSRSAGRVQSVALRLTCERESEIEAFRPQEYWTVEAKLRNATGALFGARLTHLDGRKLDKFDLPNQASAQAAVDKLLAGDPFRVAGIERKTVRRNPFPPFTTTTLQQEASRKLGLGATRTMSIAQKLYEGVNLGGETVGLITYMRTDAVQLSNEAVQGCRRLIQSQYGERYLPQSPRAYRTAAKNAQEAHEAIRPTAVARRPEQVARYLDRDQQRLYELIWKRTVASQMESAVLDQVAVDIAAARDAAMLRATGSVVAFDGFLTLYQEDRDDPAEDEEGERRLPPMAEGDAVTRDSVTPEQHFTQPPPRYTEASLVKRLEELGIGRPSTYASILQVLQDRAYVRLEKKRFLPEDRGRLVTAFLTSFFQRYVEYNFTADLETQLDDVSGGRIDWKTVLRDFWRAFSRAIEETRDLRIGRVIEALDEALGRHFFPDAGDGSDPRRCPACNQGRLSLKLGRYGAFIGCANYPECRYTRPLVVESGGNGAAEADAGPRQLGSDPATAQQVSLRKGPYGHYVQLGEANGEAKEKPKRVSLPRGMAPSEVDLDRALALLALPRAVGRHPGTGEEITAGIGRFGPYLKHGTTYKSLAADDDVLTIGLNRAVALLADGKGRRVAPGRTIGEHPKDSRPITLHSGRYGPYLRHGKTLASLPKSANAEALTLDEAVAILAAQAVKAKVKKGMGKPAAKAAGEEPAKARAAGRKPAAKGKAKTAPARRRQRTAEPT